MPVIGPSASTGQKAAHPQITCQKYDMHAK